MDSFNEAVNFFSVNRVGAVDGIRGLAISTKRLETSRRESLDRESAASLALQANDLKSGQKILTHIPFMDWWMFCLERRMRGNPTVLSVARMEINQMGEL